MSMLPSILVLGLAALWAATLTRSRSSPAEFAGQRRRAAAVLAAVVAVQGLHFIEEAATGFDVRLPGLFGFDAMPRAGFIGFNATWLVIWIVSVAGVRAGSPMAFFAAWFLAIGAMFNGIAHPVLAIAERGYFPGLISSPIIGLGGLWLWVRLREATTTGGSGPSALREHPPAAGVASGRDVRRYTNACSTTYEANQVLRGCV